MKLLRFIRWYFRTRKQMKESPYPYNKTHVRQVAWFMSKKSKNNETNEIINTHNTI